MKQEIERKFLVEEQDWETMGKGRRYRQGYLPMDPPMTVRVRVCDDAAWLTIKGPTEGAARTEYEYLIPVEDGQSLLESAVVGRVIDKTRYVVIHDENPWEVDVFHGDNDGLVLAELELDSEEQEFEKPEWVGQEVTEDSRYYNAALVENPYKNWK